MGRTKATSDARQRILETADRLFYAEGVRAVGIDRIIAESGVAKVTLYAHFPSKDDLILAVLQYREERFMALFAEAMERHAGRGRTASGLLRRPEGVVRDAGVPGLRLHERRGRTGRSRPIPAPSSPGSTRSASTSSSRGSSRSRSARRRRSWPRPSPC